MVITEAMASGLPVITNEAAGAAELIQSGHNGMIVDSPDAVESFSVALRALVADEDLRVRLGTNARRAVENMGWDNVARRTLLLYQQVIADKEARDIKPLPRITFLVNGEVSSAAGIRGLTFGARLCDEFNIRLRFRSSSRARFLCFCFLGDLILSRPSLIYVIDNAFSGILAAAAYKALTGTRILVDTGDAIYELAKSLGSRGPIRLWLTKQLELLTLRIADFWVVRGTAHKKLLESRGISSVTVIQDAVDVSAFQVEDPADLRRRLGLTQHLTVGLVGSVTWSRRHRMAYGWELLELLHLLPDVPVKGVLIGAGSGLERLKRRARELGLTERMVFVGAVPFDELPKYLHVIDVCLSTQSNDLALVRLERPASFPLYGRGSLYTGHQCGRGEARASHGHARQLRRRQGRCLSPSPRA